jgi:hypothetical protein
MCGTTSLDIRLAGYSVWSNASCHSSIARVDDVCALGSADDVHQDVDRRQRPSPSASTTACSASRGREVCGHVPSRRL